MIKFILCLRILFIISGLVNTLVYLLILSEPDLLAALKVWQSNFVLALYVVCSAIHTYGLLQTCCTRKSNKTATENQWRITIMISSFKKWCEKKYDYLLVAREMIEIPIWTLQCFYFGQQSSDRGLIFLFASVLALECFLTPILMKHVTNPTRRLIVVEMCDVLYDFLLGILIPTLPFIKIVADIAINGLNLSDLLFVTRAHNAALLFLIKSPLEVIWRVVLPFLMSHVILGDITSRVQGTLKDESKNKKKKRVSITVRARLSSFKAQSSNIVPVQSSRLKAVKRLLSIASQLWGISVLGITIEAITKTSICEGVACALRTYPWTLFSPSLCPCSAGGFDCNLQDIPTDAKGFSQQLVRSFSPNIMNFFSIYHCPITLLPTELVDFQNLFTLQVFNTTLTNFNIPIDQFPHLIELLLDSAGNLGPTLPTTLKKLGPAMLSVSLKNVQIKTLPSHFSESWKSQTRWLDLRSNQLVQFPVQLNQLEGLVYCDLSLTSLQAIPSDFIHGNLEELFVHGNALNSLPGNLLQQFPKLNNLRVDENNIVDLSHLNVSQARLEKMIHFTFAGNPVCSAPDEPWKKWHFSSTIFGCDDPGSIECSPGCFSDRIEDYRCDYECNLHACNYDNGDCQYVQVNTYLSQLISPNNA